jgi:hypothetical protein
MANEIHNYKQLIELAVLDAHGLLDPIESDVFTRSFHDAPASIQDEIIQMQRDFALDDSLLPSDVPNSSLKKQVLHAVAEAADQEARRLAPLALIGARASAMRGKLGTSKQTYFWRTAALILFGVAVVLGIMAVESNQRATRVAQIAMNLNATSTITNTVGPDFNLFIDNPYCHVTRLEREYGNNDGYIRVAVNERFGGGYVIGLDLLDGEEIIIQGTTADGEVIELARINADGSIVGHSFDIAKELIPGLTIAAVDANTGKRWI